MGVLWFTGLESGGWPAEFDAFATGSSAGTPSVVTTPVRSGAYALSLDSGDRLSLSYGATLPTPLYVRVYLRVTANPSSNALVFQTTDNVTHNAFRIWITSAGKCAWSINGGALVATGATSVSLTVWNLIETKLVKHASSGGVELVLNGTTEFTSLGSNTNFNQNGLDWGPYLGGGQTFVYDDLMLRDDQYAGAGHVIARQGIAGTPTHDTWTKTGGATADAVWSDTPANTATYAVPPGGGGAQTMLIAAFNTTQAGHGTETIASYDTIHAIAIGVWVITASALQARRIIDGTTSDSGNLANVNKFQWAGPYTATASGLNTAEAGGTGASGSSIADIWLMVAYSEGVAPPEVPIPFRHGHGMVGVVHR